MDIKSKNDAYAWVLGTIVSEYYQLQDRLPTDIYWVMRELEVRCAQPTEPQWRIEDFLRAAWVAFNYVERWVCDLSGEHVVPEFKELSLMANLGYFKRFAKAYLDFNKEQRKIDSPHNTELQKFLELRKEAIQGNPLTTVEV